MSLTNLFFWRRQGESNEEYSEVRPESRSWVILLTREVSSFQSPECDQTSDSIALSFHASFFCCRPDLLVKFGQTSDSIALLSSNKAKSQVNCPDSSLQRGMEVCQRLLEIISTSKVHRRQKAME